MAKPSKTESTTTEVTEVTEAPVTQSEAQSQPAAQPETQATPAAATPAAVTGLNATARREGNTMILASGERRVDYIKRRFFKEGATRGAIAKELGVAYQIVFAATKKPKEQAPVAQAAAAAVATQATSTEPAAAQ
jgi:hypothetical protein